MHHFCAIFDEYASTVLYTALTAIIGGVVSFSNNSMKKTVRAVSETLAGKGFTLQRVETMLRIEAEQIEERKRCIKRKIKGGLPPHSVSRTKSVNLS